MAAIGTAVRVLLASELRSRRQPSAATGPSPGCPDFSADADSMQAHAIYAGKRRRRGLLSALLVLHLLAACWLVLRGSKRSRAGADAAAAAPNLIL